MQNIVNYIKHPSRVLLGIVKKMRFVLPDRPYLKLFFFFRMDRKLNLKDPKTFNEKLQWLKLYDRNPEYIKMVDKLAAKKYVTSIIGGQYVTKVLKVWDRPEDIDLSALPDKFVLKTSHGGGGSGVVICQHKDSFDVRQAQKKLQASMSYNIYRSLCEWPYDFVERKIFAEEYIESEEELNDYKFFCFNGKVEYFKIDFGRFVEHHANYYDKNCNIAYFGEADLLPVYTHKIIIPNNIKEMIDIAEKLSKDKPFIRVDLYNVNGKIYFGELTLYPASGLGKFSPEEWDLYLGELIKLPELS